MLDGALGARGDQIALNYARFLAGFIATRAIQRAESEINRNSPSPFGLASVE